MKKIIITIDGYSGTGKSTIAKKVAHRLGYVYVDTGAMYRAVTYLALTEGFITMTTIQNHGQFEEMIHVEEEKLIHQLKISNLSFEYDSELGFSPMYLNGKNIEKEIRSIEVASMVSYIAKIPKVREYLVDSQRKMGENKGIVMDGRDIGTVVFPNAELKLFMIASEEIRAERRYNELISKGEKVSLEEVLANIRQRDAMDTSRTESPLQKAIDAVELDNSYTSIDHLVEQIVEIAQKRM